MPLVAARAAGIPTGGWMPAGFLAHDGKHPEFAETASARRAANATSRGRPGT